MKNIFVIGGSNIYKQCLTFADKLIVTEIDAVFDGNVYFPAYKDLFDNDETYLNKIGLVSKNGLSYNIKYLKRI